MAETPLEAAVEEIVKLRNEAEQGQWLLKAAQLEIDTQTHVIRRLVLARLQATVTYTLVETRSLDPDQYRLEGHLEPGARIYTRSNNPELRRAKLRGS